MTFVSLTDVHQGQHHEDEGLEGNDQDVEDGPGRACQNVEDPQTSATHGQGRAHSATGLAVHDVCRIPASDAAKTEAV